jgi:hypothetical protein
MQNPLLFVTEPRTHDSIILRISGRVGGPVFLRSSDKDSLSMLHVHPSYLCYLYLRPAIAEAISCRFLTAKVEAVPEQHLWCL